MIFRISHTTEYSYSTDIFLEPHYFSFKPKETPHSVLKDFSFKTDPEPAGFSEQIDVENNHKLFYWFEGTQDNLRIISHSTIEVEDFNPFNFLIHPAEHNHLPFEYDSRTHRLLKPSLDTVNLSDPLVAYTERIMGKSHNRTLDFLTELTKDIHEKYSLVIREDGNPYPPDITFKQKEGSCRDLAWMQVQMLRKIGVASRFVSGYLYLDAENPEFELHAWVEVYLPGAGWIGLDPSHGIFSSGYHIPVASSAYYQNTMPVIGSIRGSAQSAMKSSLNISLID